MSAPLYLCANSRLAQDLKARRPAAGAAVWATCEALTVGVWLGRLLEESALSGQSTLLAGLDGIAECLLWEQIIAESLAGETAPLFDIRGMAATAAEANALCEAWELGPALRAPVFSLSDETRRFLDWQREFRKRCANNAWQDAARQQLAAITLISEGKLVLPKTVIFAGFDRYSPLERRLQAALQEQGVSVSTLETPAVGRPHLHALACTDSSAECQAIARWAKGHLTTNPTARLGVVVPDLSRLRDSLEFALDDTLHPEALSAAHAETPRLYNFSLGRPLTALPLVDTALRLLALASSRRVEQAELSALLLTPYWSAGEREADARALLDAAMRRTLDAQLTLNDLLTLARRLHAREEIHCPGLLRQLAELLDAIAKAGSKRRPPSAWAPLFQHWLSVLQWPGRTLASHEHQAKMAFLDTIGQLAELDELLGNISLNETNRRLRELSGEQVFQPKTQGEPPLQVLGVLESAGLQFDALWVMGMNDHLWPPGPRPNPLLPAELQRRAASPHASAEVELAFASAVHSRLLAAAPDISFSFAQQEGNKLLRASPLIAGIAVSQDAPPPRTHAPVTLESLMDWQAPPVADGEKVGGGTGLLKAQAICPAWGYYQYRLGAQALKTAVEGLDPMQRGTLVHGALEYFWRATLNSTSLRSMTPEALSTAIAQAVEAALADFEAETEQPMPPRGRSLEKARLSRLIQRWLEFERDQRGQPFTVLVCEQEAILEIEGIRVRTIIDRVDQLNDGRLLVIDYKTGQSIDIKNWASERITEPQLPIYAAIAVPQQDENHAVAGVAFAKVLSDAPTFAGVSEEAGMLPKVTGLDDEKRKIFEASRFPDWETLLEHWYWRLHAIAQEIKAGDAGVRFADANDLQFCEVMPLLRLAERQQQLESSQ